MPVTTLTFKPNDSMARVVDTLLKLKTYDEAGEPVTRERILALPPGDTATLKFDSFTGREITRQGEMVDSVFSAAGIELDRSFDRNAGPQPEDMGRADVFLVHSRNF